ncbi:MAG: SpoIID/LytB domain-containing protein [Nocardioidaceae bacterium]|nr:SpoIID/LytB domain-containing protein [Nocardioidaceae bacterium]
MNRRALAAGALVWTVAVTLLVAPSTAAAKRYWVPYTGTLAVEGHGYGHGRGMSQYGAEGAARAGKSTGQILDFYYRGTKSGKTGGPLRVLVTKDTTSQVTVAARRKLAVRDLADGRAWRLPRRPKIDQWRITPARGQAVKSAVQFHNRAGWQRWPVPGRTLLRGVGQFTAGGAPIGLVLPNGEVRRYRGILRATPPYRGAGIRDTVNVVSLDQYVRGVLPAEMPTSWSMAALRAQAVAARTYAAYGRRANRSRYWHVCDTTTCQVYGGVRAETKRGNQAVLGTARTIRKWHGRPALTQFSSSSGGWTVSGGRPYLRARADRFDGWQGNANHRWRTRVDSARLERRFGELGRLQHLTVRNRDGHGAWGGRVQQVVLHGRRRTVGLSGESLRFALGLRSSWVTFGKPPIIAAWQRLGGAKKSPFGRPIGAESRVRNDNGLTGARHAFTKGRMYWSKRTGAHGLRGAVLTYYQRHGGVRSSLGFPNHPYAKTDGGGHKAQFQGGAVIHHDRWGAHAVTGRILRAYRRHGFVNGRLGYPTTEVRRIDVGRRVKFQHGRITWLRRSGQIDVDISR